MLCVPWVRLKNLKGGGDKNQHALTNYSRTTGICFVFIFCFFFFFFIFRLTFILFFFSKNCFFPDIPFPSLKNKKKSPLTSTWFSNSRFPIPDSRFLPPYLDSFTQLSTQVPTFWAFFIDSFTHSLTPFQF